MPTDTKKLAEQAKENTRRLNIKPITEEDEEGLRNCHQKKMALSPRALESMTLFGKPSDKKLRFSCKSMPTLGEVNEDELAEVADTAARASTR